MIIILQIILYITRKNNTPQATKRQDIEEDQKDLVDQSSDNKSIKNILLGYTSHDRLLISKSSSFLREVKFSKQEFPIHKSISNMKYHHLRSQNNNLFYLFNDQLDYTLVYFFVDFETTKDNINGFLSNLLMAPFNEKLFYQNADKQIEKLLDILLGIPNNKGIKYKCKL